MLTLYYANGTCALAAHIALEFAGAQYEAVRVDFSRQQQQSPEYLKINPKGRVPALVTPQGVITETPAILLYIAQTHPQAQLAPLGDPFALAKVNEFNCYLCATVHIAHAHRPRAYRWADDEQAQAAMRAKVPQNMAECFGLVEEQLFAGPWVMGAQFTICDPYLFTVAGWLKGDGVDIQRFPKVAEHSGRMRADARLQQVLAAHAA
jgi:glutathione S-transferase